MIQTHFRSDSYLGEVFYLDPKTQEVVAQGQGYLHMASMTFSTDVKTIKPGSFEKLLLIMKTSDGFVAPFATYYKTFTEQFPDVSSYNTRAYLLWPVDHGMLYILNHFPRVHITIQARHAPDKTHSTIHSAGTTEQLIQHAAATRLSSYTHLNHLTVDVSSGYAIRRVTEQVRDQLNSQLETYITYHVTSKQSLSFNNLGNILMAFRLYWLTHFDSTDCTIKYIQLGNYIRLYLNDNKLRAASVRIPEYQSAPRLCVDLHADTLAKMSYFFLNPKKLKRLGPTSKIGLAFSRIVDYRFRRESELLYMNMTSLIFALQSFSEGVAEREIQKANRQTKQQTLASIRKVLDVIYSIKDELASEVVNFYLRSDNEIYTLLSRPTFMASLETALKTLNIDPVPHKRLLKIISSTRRQVVHSEGYDADFLLRLLVNSTTQMEIGEKKDRFQHGTTDEGNIADLYQLLRQMIRSYF